MIPEFFRVQWTSLQAKEKWEPIISRIANEALRVEVESVRKGFRSAAFITGSPQLTRRCSGGGLDSLVIDVVSASDVYRNAASQYEPGKPFSLRTIIGSSKTVDEFAQAYHAKDHKTIGKLLGYPDCCIQNFIDNWGKDKTDLTWVNTRLYTNQSKCAVVPWTEILPMWLKLNVRAFYHIPCSYLCNASYEQARELGLHLWHPEIWDDYKEILSWPVEWSALHGAAEIRTPILKMLHNTEWTSEERLIQFVGTNYPKEGANSDQFPYNLKHNIAYNNGFRELETMKLAHEPILNIARGLEIRSIYDPGCGNGYLLTELGTIHPSATISGVDLNEHAIREGRLLDDLVCITHKDMFSVEYPSADLVVLMPGRLAEVSEEKARAYVSRLNYRYLILYVYQDHADDLWDLKEKFFPQLRVVTTEVNETTTAVLLEKQ